MWQTSPTGLSRTFVFPDFKAAFAFMTQVAAAAEKHQHHPDWRNCWNRVEITLCTHDAGNTITSLDYQLATAIDEIYATF